MPVIQARQLRTVCEVILQAVGTPADTAEYVAFSLVECDLMGHDSHGVIRLPDYVGRIQEGRLDPRARPNVVRETPVAGLVDGNWSFGQVAMRYAAQRAVEQARKAGLSAVGVVRANHLGRLGEFAATIAEAGMIGMVVVGGFRARDVAPHGGAARAMGTNPYAFAVPAGAFGTVVVDFATSGIAEGKLRIARAAGLALPPGLLLNKDGLPSTDPADFYAGGMLLPMAGHKGYGLALIADLLASTLIAAPDHAAGGSPVGALLLAIDIATFRPVEEFIRETEARLAELKAVPPAPGFQEVLIPGEPEYRTKRDRERDGIRLGDGTWQSLTEIARSLGVDVQ
ncbi:MAG: Ldh family oxidoreductase [Chloroflexi bacterium]|nr:Ldh family oxidoreductase [Chloroflexota bacterium]